MILTQSNREILNLAVPSMFALMAEPLMGIMDTMLIGNYGTNELAATAGISAILSMSLWLFNFLSTGTTAKIAFLFGSKNHKSIGSYISSVIIISLIIGFLLSIIYFFFDMAVIGAYGFQAEVYPLAKEYLNIRLIGLPFTMLLYSGIGFYRGLQNAVTPMITAILSNAINLILDIILIYGVEGIIPEMGIAGAAWATVAAQIFGVGYLLFDVLHKKLNRIYPLNFRTKFKDFTQLFTTSRHLFFRTLFLLLGFLTAGSVAARMGNTILAGHEISMKLWLLGSFTIDAFAVAGQSLIGKYLGEHASDKKLGRLIRNLLSWGVSLGFIFAVTYWCFSDTIIAFFTNDSIVVAAVGQIFFLLVIFQPASAVTFVLDGILIGMDKTRFMMQMMLIATLIFISTSITSYYLDWGLTGIWWGLCGLMTWRFFTNILPVRKYLIYR